MRCAEWGLVLKVLIEHAIFVVRMSTMNIDHRAIQNCFGPPPKNDMLKELVLAHGMLVSIRPALVCGRQMGFRCHYLLTCPFFDDRCHYSAIQVIDVLHSGAGLRQRDEDISTEGPLDHTDSTMERLHSRIVDKEYRMFARSSTRGMSYHFRHSPCRVIKWLTEDNTRKLSILPGLTVHNQILCPRLLTADSQIEKSVVCLHCMGLAGVQVLDLSHRMELLKAFDPLRTMCTCVPVVPSIDLSLFHNHEASISACAGSVHKLSTSIRYLHEPGRDSIAAGIVGSIQQPDFTFRLMNEKQIRACTTFPFEWQPTEKRMRICFITENEEGVWECIPGRCPSHFGDGIHSCSVVTCGWTSERLALAAGFRCQAVCRRYHCRNHGRWWTLDDLHRLSSSSHFKELFVRNKDVRISRPTFLSANLIIDETLISFMIKKMLIPKPLIFQHILTDVHDLFETMCCCFSESMDEQMQQTMRQRTAEVCSRMNRNVLDGLIPVLNDVFRMCLDLCIRKNRQKPARSLSFDSTFKLLSNVGSFIAKRWQKDKSVLTLVLNEEGALLGYAVSKTEDNLTNRTLLEEIFRDLPDKEYLLVVSSDNVHSHGAMIRDIFGPTVLHCQDIWHVWVQRIAPAVPRGHPDAAAFRAACTKIFAKLRRPGDYASVEDFRSDLETLIVEFSSLQSEIDLAKLTEMNPYALLSLKEALIQSKTRLHVSRSTRYRRWRAQRGATETTGHETFRGSDLDPAVDQRTLMEEQNSEADDDIPHGEPDPLHLTETHEEDVSDRPILTEDDSESASSEVNELDGFEIAALLFDPAESNNDPEDSPPLKERRSKDHVAAILEKHGIEIAVRPGPDPHPLMAMPELRKKINSLLSDRNVQGLFVYQLLSKEASQGDVSLGSNRNEKQHGVGNSFANNRRLTLFKAMFIVVVGLLFKEISRDEEVQSLLSSLVKNISVAGRRFKSRYQRTPSSMSGEASARSPTTTSGHRFALETDTAIVDILSDLGQKGCLRKRPEELAKSVAFSLQRDYGIDREPHEVRKRITYLLRRYSPGSLPVVDDRSGVRPRSSSFIDPEISTEE